MKKHDHGCTSNTDDVFRAFIGCKVRGVIRNHSDRILVFECGWGLTFNLEHASYWVNSPEEVQKKLYQAKSGLQNTKKELEGILKLARENL